MHLLSICFSLATAAVLCGLLALVSIALAFPGADRAAAFMSHPAALAAVSLLTAAMLACGIRSLRRKRSASALMHLGCSLILGGWCAGRLAERGSSPERPFTGSMALIDGEKSDMLWKGDMLDIPVGRLPFTVELEKFFIKRYGDAESPVKEYRSHVLIGEEGKTPYPRDIRVNHPARVCGYWIYQMSWGQARDRMGNPVTYTVLQFNRDPGVFWVFAGFAVLFAGSILFATRLASTSHRDG